MAGALRIHAVARLTGVPEPTIRAWERRYGVPRPSRTPAGYRLYGSADVADVERMRDLCAGGMAAADAAREVGKRTVESPLVGTLVEAAARLDARALDEALAAAMHVGTAREMIETVIAPPLHRIGQRWADGSLGIAHEHFASERIAAFLRAVLRLRSADHAAHTKDRARVVVASFDEDQHGIAALAVAVCIADLVDPLVLGARTPPDAVAEAIETSSARGVMLSVTVAPPREQTPGLVRAYASACGRLPWTVGGAAASELRRAVEKAGGHVAETLEEGVRFVAHKVIGARRA